MLPWSILQYIWPALSDYQSWKSFLLSSFEWLFKTGLTVTAIFCTLDPGGLGIAGDQSPRISSALQVTPLICLSPVISHAHRWMWNYPVPGPAMLIRIPKIVFSSPEPKAQRWCYSIPMVRRPAVRPSSSSSSFTISNIFFSETAWPIKAKFYVEPHWVGGTKVCSRHLGHMTKMAARPIYGKNPSKIFFSRTGGM